MPQVLEAALVEPIHTAVRGRARYRVEGLQGCSLLKDHLMIGLSSHEAVVEVSSSTVTGSVLVRFNSGNDFKAIAALIELLVAEYRAGVSRKPEAFRATDPARGAPLPSVPAASPQSLQQAIAKAKGALFSQSPIRYQPDEPWHTMPSTEAAARLRCAPARGLDPLEAKERLEQYGANALPEALPRSGWSIFLDQFKSLPVALLGVAAGISVVTGGLADAVVILGVVAINGVIGYVTESEAEKTIHSLKDLVKPTAEVLAVRRDHPLLRVNYRSEQRLFMGTLHAVNGGSERGYLLAVKGSPVEVLDMCDCHLMEGVRKPLSDEDRERIQLENDRMAADALRVLGLARAIVASEEDFGAAGGLMWLGLIGMADLVRPGVTGLIEQFHRAGIDTIMITGDQSPTAYAIGKELNLSRGQPLEIMDSAHLNQMGAETLTALSDKVHVFARVTPAFKLEIVQALQRKGKVVAMTGDGINDGPALKAADIGIAMGEGGTDIAREVADVVLEQDNLETVIVAVRDGRTIYHNIRKSLRFLLATNFSEIMVMFLTVAAGLPSPMTAMQLLWINLLSDIFPGLALALEQPEEDVLNRPPRTADEPIIKTSDFKRLTFEASTLSLGAMTAYGYGIMRYGTGANAGTLAFHSLTMGQLLHALSCRSETHGFFDGRQLPPNPYLTVALSGSFAVQCLTIFLPGLRGLLGLTPINLLDGAVIAGTAALPLLINEGTKVMGTGGNTGEDIIQEMKRPL